MEFGSISLGLTQSSLSVVENSPRLRRVRL
jgi:hypothetical protein